MSDLVSFLSCQVCAFVVGLHFGRMVTFDQDNKAKRLALAEAAEARAKAAEKKRGESLPGSSPGISAACSVCKEVPDPSDPGLSRRADGEWVCIFCDCWDIPLGPKREALRKKRRME